MRSKDRLVTKLVESVTETTDAKADDTLHVPVSLVPDNPSTEHFKGFGRCSGKYPNVTK